MPGGTTKPGGSTAPCRGGQRGDGQGAGEHLGLHPQPGPSPLAPHTHPLPPPFAHRRQDHAVADGPAVEGQVLLVAHAARVAQRARAQRAAPPLRRLVAAAVEAHRAPPLLACAAGGRGRRGGVGWVSAAGLCGNTEASRPVVLPAHHAQPPQRQQHSPRGPPAPLRAPLLPLLPTSPLESPPPTLPRESRDSLQVVGKRGREGGASSSVSGYWAEHPPSSAEASRAWHGTHARRWAAPKAGCGWLSEPGPARALAWLCAPRPAAA